MNSLPSISQNNLPVGHRVTIDGQEYQVAMTKGRRPRRYWKKVRSSASASRAGPTKFSIQYFERMATKYLGAQFKRYQINVPSSTLLILLYSAIQSMPYQIIHNDITFPRIKSRKTLLSELWYASYRLLYIAWLRYPTTYLYLQSYSMGEFPRHPLYQKRFIPKLASILPSGTVFRTDNYRAKGVHYTYKGQAYDMDYNSGAQLIVRLIDLERLGLDTVYVIDQDHARYQLTDHIWYHPINDELRQGPENWHDIVSVQELNNYPQGLELYKQLKLYAERTDLQRTAMSKLF